MIKLFCDADNKTCIQFRDYGLLVLRLVVGIFMLTHGWAKLSNFSEMSQEFPPMLGLSPQIGLTLIVFAEFFCSIAIILGLLTRLSTIPLIIGMGVAAFVAHAADPFSAKEMALLYLGVYVTLLLTGAGKLSFDRLIYNKFYKKENI
ncbi:MAG: DoxX family protein [Porphyromonadaceae bacterium]|jgi:putative oxidoreductase|nr:DoxX family protein [Porphyromonadaceae bacterium]